MSRKRIFAALGIVLALLLAVGFALWRRQNIKALTDAVTKDSAAVAAELEEALGTLEATLPEAGFSAPSMEQTEALLEGYADPEAIKAELGLSAPAEDAIASEADAAQAPPKEKTSAASGGAAGSADLPVTPEAPASAEQSAPAEKTPAASGGAAASADPAETAEDHAPAEQSAPDNSVQPAVDTDALADGIYHRCVAELYALQVDVMAELGRMKKAALDEWGALPEEKRTSIRKQQIGMAGLRKCYAYEVTVDAEVHKILDRGRADLTAIGADDDRMDMLWTYYVREKEAQKTYYLQKYL